MKYVRVKDVFELPPQRQGDSYWVVSSLNVGAAGLTPGNFTHTLTLPGSSFQFYIEQLWVLAQVVQGVNTYVANWLSISIPPSLNQVSILAGVLAVPQSSSMLYQGKIIDLSNYVIKIDALRQFTVDVQLLANSFPGVAVAAADPVITQVGLLVNEA